MSSCIPPSGANILKFDGKIERETEESKAWGLFVNYKHGRPVV